MSAEASEPRPPAPVRPLRSAPWVRLAAFFLLYYLCILFTVDPARIYYGYWLTGGFPVFRTGWEFLREHVAEPGKPTEYAAAFLCQLYARPWLGALAITAVAALLCLGAWSYAARLSGRRPAVAHYVPALVLLLTYNLYRNPMAAGLGLLAATACACAYAALRTRRAWARLLAFVALFGVCYYLAGGASLIFAWLCALFAAVSERRPSAWAAYAAVAAGVPYLVGKSVLKLRITDAYFRLWFFHQDSNPRQAWFVAALYAFFVLLPLWACLWPRLRGGLARVACAVRMPSVEKSLARLAGDSLRRAALWAVPFALGVAAICASYDAQLRTTFEVEYCARHRMWADLLRAARRLRAEHYTFFVNWDVNRALYYTGQMPDRMFAYPQNALGLVPNPMAFSTEQVRQPVWIRLSDVLWDLGRVNEAEHMEYEALEFLGDHPDIIRHLALIAVAKEETETARILLGALRRDVWSRRWAAAYLKRLAADPSASFDEQIQQVRALMVDEDVVGWMAPADILRQSLEKNAGNRMAFEYLMADCLLNRELERFADNIGRLKGFAYPSLPRHYEEALLLYAASTGAREYAYWWSISDATVRRHRQFVEALRRYGANAAAAEQGLAGEFGDTYFYYYAFGKSGVGQ